MNKRMQSPARCDVQCQAQALNHFYRCLRKNPELPSWEKRCRISSALTAVSNPDFFSVQIDLPPTLRIARGLPGLYAAVQMHLHWGGLDPETSGSEHTLDGMRYVAEVPAKAGWREEAILSENLSHFYRYQCSLTTPPCSEILTWTIFDAPVVLSHTQVRTWWLFTSHSGFFPSCCSSTQVFFYILQ